MYDPLGWVIPVIITAKIFIQRLWLRKVTWDEALPDELLDQWRNYHSQLTAIKNISIPRWNGQGSDTLRYEIHGFSDASSAAYGATVYLRVLTLDGSVKSTLILAKSKVVPLKPISIPRLELTAALLLSRCVTFASASLTVEAIPCHCWTDSTVTLTWIRHHPSKWKSFVANRVYAIQTQLPNATWHHVSSSQNPADLASRGVSAVQLADSSLWWHGPAWLRLSSDHWPTDAVSFPQIRLIEERSPSAQHASPVSEWDLSQRYSSWSKLLRVTAYIFRFITRAHSQHSLSRSSLPSRSLALASEELNTSRVYWLKYIQAQRFSEDRSRLLGHLPLSSKSPLRSLHPFLDEQGLIRVGGKLQHANLPETTKHPIILASHPLVKVLIRHIHLRALHAGPTLTLLTLHLLREDYWLLRARQMIRALIHDCVECVRQKGESVAELMGDLPSFRVQPSLRAFIHCGVDYVGPFQVRYAPGRGRKSYKAYVALFICMVTRALHLDLVSDYTTPAFLAAYKRFCARRRVPSYMYSDNAKNFRGAQRELALAWKTATRNPELLISLAEEGVAWHFLPRSAPHFGGLWEAGVKSMKHHLKR